MKRRFSAPIRVPWHARRRAAACTKNQEGKTSTEGEKNAKGKLQKKMCEHACYTNEFIETSKSIKGTYLGTASGERPHLLSQKHVIRREVKWK